MAKVLVPDDLWGLVEPLLPTHTPSPKGGKPRVPDRVCLTGISAPTRRVFSCTPNKALSAFVGDGIDRNRKSTWTDWPALNLTADSYS